MRIGVYASCLQDLSIDEVVPILAGLGLDSIEVNVGGFIPSPHIPIERLMGSADARSEYRGAFTDAGLTLTALNCNGNPLHPDPAVRGQHAADLRRAIELAALLDVRRVVTMSGIPEAHAGGRMPSWAVVPWDSVWLDVRDYQWDEVAIPFWRTISDQARDRDVRIAIEMHPGMLVYNPATLLRLIDAVGASHIGAEMDPSHLFWQGIDPVAAIEHLGPLVYNAAAKDTRMNEAVRINGVLDDRFGRVDPDDPDAIGLGGRSTLSRWPTDPSWQFVSVGRGHDVAYWTSFLAALERIDPDMAVNIEHEDHELERWDGIRFAARTLLEAREALASGGT
jgi:sugar phosphate isomerase/epimerase